MELCIYSFVILVALSVLNLTSFLVIRGLVNPKFEVCTLHKIDLFRYFKVPKKSFVMLTHKVQSSNFRRILIGIIFYQLDNSFLQIFYFYNTFIGGLWLGIFKTF